MPKANAGPKGCINRRSALAHMAKAGACALGSPLLMTSGSASAAVIDHKVAAEPGLASVAQTKGLDFGASFAVHELDQSYGRTYASLYTQDVHTISSELCLKIPVLRPDAHVLDFEPADRFFSFAEKNKLHVHGHTLIWDDYLPDWIKKLGRDEVKHVLQAHIMTVLERYRGKAKSWDVVNEPIAPWDHNPGNLRQGPFYNAFGEDYIVEAFKLARRFEPDAHLILNEAQTESDDENGETFRKSLLALIKRQLDQGAPIDGIGLQCHLQSARRYDFPRFADFIYELLALGLEVRITELDINDSAFAADIKKRDQQVAALYKSFLKEILAITEIKSLTLWQLSDRTSWMADPFIAPPLRRDRKPSRPLIYDKDFKRKPAWYVFEQAFRDMPPRKIKSIKQPN